eukprot:CAMPEP_0181429548 /NCGR_PEP_ID=MMETSP1110-20121109/17259_1 /TAXON_ID=174948 /ORGANISM="Symbiodinium sp., Strain CCMP421" /LENGTH=545 /DNA_ID=CAMNT_0023552825 /DNA_START=51 /DNA_END=1687 /DNA_ORIENTATION=-
MALVLGLQVLFAFAQAMPEDVVRSCKVFCQGELLDVVQRARLFPDSKSFVDMPLRVDPEEALEAFQHVNKSDHQALKAFVEQNFEEAGGELTPCTPDDFPEQLPALAKISQQGLKRWAAALHHLWKDLCRKQKPSVAEKPWRFSALPQKRQMVVPGGRFRETYYWDTYWIVRGLLLSGMNETAKGVTENLLDYVRAFGFVPNGGRVYYLDRSQPPMLTEMVAEVHAATLDDQWLAEVLPVLEKEYDFWMNSSLHHYLPELGLNVFASQMSTPRPESYFEDLRTAAEAQKLGRKAEEVYRGIRSGAETGWDFSTAGSANASEGMASVDAHNVVPVDLNCVLLRMERHLAFFRRREGGGRFAAAAARRERAMRSVLWVEDLKSFRDFRLDLGRPSAAASISDFAAPLWAGLGKKDRAFLEALKTSGLLQVGGASTTLLPSGQQWDAPNAWAPLQLMLVEGLEQMQLPGATELAEEMAKRWLRNCFEAWQKQGAMFEKYDVVGQGGGGGEYTPQTGFGWSNGVALALLVKNDERSSPYVPGVTIFARH